MRNILLSLFLLLLLLIFFTLLYSPASLHSHSITLLTYDCKLYSCSHTYIHTYIHYSDLYCLLLHKSTDQTRAVTVLCYCCACCCCCYCFLVLYSRNVILVHVLCSCYCYCCCYFNTLAHAHTCVSQSHKFLFSFDAPEGNDVQKVVVKLFY